MVVRPSVRPSWLAETTTTTTGRSAKVGWASSSETGAGADLRSVREGKVHRPFAGRQVEVGARRMDGCGVRGRDVVPARETTRGAGSEGEARGRTEGTDWQCRRGRWNRWTTDEKRTARRKESPRPAAGAKSGRGLALRGAKRVKGPREHEARQLTCDSSPLRGSRRTRLRTQFSGRRPPLVQRESSRERADTRNNFPLSLTAAAAAW